MKVTQELNDMLTNPFSALEISDALFQIGPLKPPDPNGFLARFFQRHWGILKGQINAAVKVFFQTIIIPVGANTNSIVLIPKVDSLSKLSDFRPINLCNVIYKVVSKCLVNRLRPVLDDIISPYRSSLSLVV